MKRYFLIRYDLSGSEDFCYGFEQNEHETAIKMAKTHSMIDGDLYTYRLETWENNQFVGELRFFHNGEEFTRDVIEAMQEGKNDE